MDIVYAIDGSQAVGIEAFNAMKRFVQHTVSLYQTSPEMAHVGVVVYGGEKALVPLSLRQGTSNVAVQRAIRQVMKSGGKRLMDVALNEISNEFKLQSVREGVGKLAVLLTTGEDESLDKSRLKEISEVLEAQGVKMAIVKIGQPLRNETVDGIGKKLVDNVKNVKSPSRLEKEAMEVVEEAVANSSRKCSMYSNWKLVLIIIMPEVSYFFNQF